ICPDCKMAIKPLDFQRCIVCQNRAPFGLTHPKCLTGRPADQLISFFDYHDETVAAIIIKGKYKFIPGVYKILGQMMAEKIKKDHNYLLTPNPFPLTATLYPLTPPPYTLVPIPFTLPANAGGALIRRKFY